MLCFSRAGVYNSGMPNDAKDDRSENDEGWAALIAGLRAGDQAIVRDFCAQYGDALFRLADKHLAEGLRRRIGPEDVVQSACRTFFRRAQGGEFQLDDNGALWGVLCAITLTKVREQSRFHLRGKRGVQREVGVDPTGERRAGWDVAAAQPTPDEAAAFTELFQKVLSGLDEEERQLVDLKLQQYTNKEAAKRMACSERTVRRILKRVQQRLALTLDVS